MAADVLSTINTRRTDQRVQADPREVKNSAGGYVFSAGDEVHLHRFLTIGTTGGTYYASEAELTKDNAELVLRWARERTNELVDKATAISVAGRAPKVNPAIFALAAAAGLGDVDGRRYALGKLDQVCRTGTHLFLFARYIQQFRGWGPSLTKGVGRWYTGKDLDALAYQLVKYRQREGWSHRDLLRRAHPKTDEADRNALLRWVTQHEVSESLPRVVIGFEQAQKATSVREWVELIQRYPLSWEMLPDAALGQTEVWEALIAKGMPQTALLRQLPRLTNLGILAPMSTSLQVVTSQLADVERLRKGRVHPVNVLLALKTYALGHSMRGSGTWTPVPQVIDALDAAFYAAYGAVEPSGKRHLLALDVSGSMGWPTGQLMTAREITTALAMVTAAVEGEGKWGIVGFTGGSQNISTLPISPRQRLDDSVRLVSNLPMGPTDCSLPMLFAQKHKVPVDVFEILTDNETWHGHIHPMQALRDYRQASGIDAKLVVVATTPTKFSIADPLDSGTLDISGFDSAVPNLLSDFSRGDV